MFETTKEILSSRQVAFRRFGECNRQTHKTAEFVGGRRGEQSRKRRESDGKQPLGVSVKPATPIH